METEDPENVPESRPATGTATIHYLLRNESYQLLIFPSCFLSVLLLIKQISLPVAEVNQVSQGTVTPKYWLPADMPIPLKHFNVNGADLGRNLQTAGFFYLKLSNFHLKHLFVMLQLLSFL